MPSIFDLFGELKVDNTAFKRHLRESDAHLDKTKKKTEELEKKTEELGVKTNATARVFEKFNDKTAAISQRLQETAAAYVRGEVSAKQMATAIKTAETQTEHLNSSLKDTAARLADVAAKKVSVAPKIDTGAFGAPLQQMDARLSAVSKSIGDYQQKLTASGNVSASAARGVEAMNEKLAGVRSRLAEASAAFARGEISAKQMAGAIRSAETAVSSLGSNVKNSTARLTDLANKSVNVGDAMKKAGEGIRNAGVVLTAALTAPLVMAGKSLFDLGVSGDAMRNKLTAATGSLEGANSKLKELRSLADGSAGVLADGATDIFAFFKPLKIGEAYINDVIRAFGKLQLADSAFQGKEFGRNLTQLFTQNFELQDLKQAVGAMPRFGEIVAKQFGFEDSSLDGIKKGLQGLKATGKLTLEDFLKGFAEGVNNDSSFSKLRDDVGTRIQKSFSRIGRAFEPFALTFASVLEKVVAVAEPIVTKIGEYFSSLSPVMQTVVVAVGAFAAALGPALAVIGTVVASIAGFASSIAIWGGFSAVAATVGAALAIVAKIALPVIAVLAAVAAAGAALYLAWETNFGGIRDATLRTVETLRNFLQPAFEAVKNFAVSSIGALIAWWNDNLPQLVATVQSVSSRISAVTETVLSAVGAFWETHGARIVSYAQSYWNAVKNIISGAMTQIGNVIELVMNVVRGDWDGVWASIVKIVETATKMLAQILISLQALFTKALAAVVPIVFEYGSRISMTLLKYLGYAIAGAVYIFATLPVQLIRLIPKFIAAGAQIGSAIWKGLKEAVIGGGEKVDIPAPDFKLPDLSSFLPNFNAPQLELPAAVQEKTKTPANTSDFIDEKTLKKRRDARIGSEEETFKLSEALLKNHLARRKTDEMTALQEETRLKNQHLRAEIQIEQDYYDRMIKAAAGNKDKISELEAERAGVVRQKNAEIERNAIETETRIMEMRRQKLGEIKSLIGSLAVSISDNPILKMMIDTGTAFERAAELTRGFSKEVQNAVMQMTKLNAASNLFQQNLDNAVQATNLGIEAEKFRRGGSGGTRTLVSADYEFIDGKIGKVLSQRFGYAGGTDRSKLPNEKPEERTKRLKEQAILQNELQKKIDALYKVKTDLPESVKSRLIDKQIINLTSSADPKILNRGQNDLAAGAREREAMRYASQESRGAAVFEKIADFLSDNGAGIPVSIRDGEQFVRIVNEAPNNATVTSRPRRSDTNKRYK